jgi:probable rRNA maturation factor
VTTQSSLVVDVQVACKNSDIPSAQQIKYWVTSAVEGSGRCLADGTELSVKLVDTDEMRSLNDEYRNKDSVTNVLSFPAGEIAGLPAEAGQALGDIVVCAAVVSDEAARQGKAVGDHWAHMLVHGTLHLLGFDHESDVEAVEMEGLEARILTSNGVADPYVM